MYGETYRHAHTNMWTAFDRSAGVPPRRKRCPAWVSAADSEESPRAPTFAQAEVSLRDRKIAVADAQLDCQEMLGSIVREQFEAEDAEAAVAHEIQALRGEAAAIEEELAELEEIELEAKSAALPALAAAADALAELNRRDFAEVKAYSRPPAVVELVLCAVLVLKQLQPSWAVAKKQLGDANFLNSLVTFDRSTLNDETLEVLDAYTCRKEFQPEAIRNSSKAVYSLSTWCIAMQVFGKVELELRAQAAAVSRAQAYLDQKGRELRK